MAIIKEISNFEDFKVKIVASFPDLNVYVTKNKFEAKGRDEIWFFDNNFEDAKVKFVSNFEDLKIQYVDNKHRAGWANKQHKLQNRIG